MLKSGRRLDKPMREASTCKKTNARMESRFQYFIATIKCIRRRCRDEIQRRRRKRQRESQGMRWCVRAERYQGRGHDLRHCHDGEERHWMKELLKGEESQARRAHIAKFEPLRRSQMAAWRRSNKSWKTRQFPPGHSRLGLRRSLAMAATFDNHYA